MYDIIRWILIGWMALASLIAFGVTATDKGLSKTDRRRVPEKWFRIFALLDGGIGVLAAFYLCRHKTKHGSLLASVWILTVLMTLVSVALVLWLEHGTAGM